MMLWSFRYYLASGRTGDIKSIYQNGSVKLKAQFDTKLSNLGRMELNDWREPLAKRLSGECDGLIEIRFKADGVQQRPLGFVSANYEFTLLYWATEKNNRFVPKSACATAHVWRLNAVSKSGDTTDVWIPLE